MDLTFLLKWSLGRSQRSRTLTGRPKLRGGSGCLQTPRREGEGQGVGLRIERTGVRTGSSSHGCPAPQPPGPTLPPGETILPCHAPSAPQPCASGCFPAHLRLHRQLPEKPRGPWENELLAHALVLRPQNPQAAFLPTCLLFKGLVEKHTKSLARTCFGAHQQCSCSSPGAGSCRPTAAEATVVG